MDINELMESYVARREELTDELRSLVTEVDPSTDAIRGLNEAIARCDEQINACAGKGASTRDLEYLARDYRRLARDLDDVKVVPKERPILWIIQGIIVLAVLGFLGLVGVGLAMRYGLISPLPTP